MGLPKPPLPGRLIGWSVMGEADASRRAVEAAEVAIGQILSPRALFLAR
jgi:hypothetical protein